MGARGSSADPGITIQDRVSRTVTTSTFLPDESGSLASAVTAPDSETIQANTG